MSCKNNVHMDVKIVDDVVNVSNVGLMEDRKLVIYYFLDMGNLKNKVSREVIDHRSNYYVGMDHLHGVAVADVTITDMEKESEVFV